MTEDNHIKPNKYQNGKIYTIRSNDADDLYIGSTTQSLSKRFNDHKRDATCETRMNYPLYRKMNEVGIDKFYIELYENYPCQNIEELRKREGELIRQMGTLNKQVAGRSKKEWTNENQDKVKEYKQRHKEGNEERIKEQSKGWYEENKEHKAEYDKEYRCKNKQKIKENKCMKVECSCGALVSKTNLRRHQKSGVCNTIRRNEIN